MQIVPAPRTMFVVPLKIEKVSVAASGILIAKNLGDHEGDTEDERGKGKVMFAGEGCWAAAGSTVIYKDYEAHEVEVDGINYIVIKDDAAVGVINP